MSKLTIFCGLFSALLSGACAAQPAPSADVFRFRVLYDQKPIGQHTFTVISGRETTRVSSEARFVFKILFIPVYQYDHRAEETWVNGCLKSLRSATQDNGVSTEVALTASQLDKLFVKNCPGSFAYWDPDRLKRSELINSQTGEVASVVFTRQGSDKINGVSADRFRLAGNGLKPITLWFRREDRRWVGLETELDGGRLRYEALPIESAASAVEQLRQ